MAIVELHRRSARRLRICTGLVSAAATDNVLRNVEPKLRALRRFVLSNLSIVEFRQEDSSSNGSEASLGDSILGTLTGQSERRTPEISRHPWLRLSLCRPGPALL